MVSNSRYLMIKTAQKVHFFVNCLPALRAVHFLNRKGNKMADRIFGWSYPPGCSGPPDDYDDVSPQSEEVYVILEEADCKQEVIDAVCKIVDNLAYAAANCPECNKRAIEAEVKFYEELSVAGDKQDNVRKSVKSS